MQNIIVVVPCYNEAERFNAQRFVSAAQADPSLSFLLVDDGSTDATRAILERASQQLPAQIQALGLAQNSGKAEAVRRGLQAAFERAPAVVAYFDADLATPLEELAPMRALLEERPELHAVLGSRVGLLGRDVVRTPTRHYLGRIFASVASVLLDLNVYDTQCGAKLFRNTPAVREIFAEPFHVSWTFDVEVLARLAKLARDGTVAPLARSAMEYPLRRWRDVSGSKLEPSAALKAGSELATLWYRYGRK
ncbi:MAG TPA: glycosyltransferase [Polyangiaceae bacterium]|nr:glycosyltransferase [Polyangiaceae bacterium]